MKSLTKIGITLILGILVLVLIGVFAVSPMLKEVTTINAVVRDKKVELEVLKHQILAFKTAQSDLAKATRKNDILNAIPEKVNLVETVKNVESAALNTRTRHVLQIREVDSKDKKKPVPVTSKISGVDEIGYDLSVSNDFKGMVDFLSYLEHLPHFTEIGKITLYSERLSLDSGSQTGGRTGVVSGVLQGVFFVDSEAKK